MEITIPAYFALFFVVVPLSGFGLARIVELLLEEWQSR